MTVESNYAIAIAIAIAIATLSDWLKNSHQFSTNEEQTKIKRTLYA